MPLKDWRDFVRAQVAHRDVHAAVGGVRPARISAKIARETMSRVARSPRGS
jgi:hypothetical protein